MSDYKVTNLVGTPTDYSNKNNWVYITENPDKEVDTFFIYPTVYINPAPGAPAIVPVDDESLRYGVMEQFKDAPTLFKELTNLYEPYYRQSNLCALFGKSDEELAAFQLNEQRTDVFAALDYFFENFNEGRPFILAGHSQGSIMLNIALSDYFKEHVDYLDRMVAAYIVGFAVTPEVLNANPALKFAEGADDTGVIVSWNTEGPENKNEKNCVVRAGGISINPINWKRDDTYAPASENLGDMYPTYGANGIFPVKSTHNVPGKADARVDVDRGVVVVTTMPEQYVQPVGPGMPSPFGPASLHLVDYAAFWDNITENVKTRIKAYLTNH